MEQDDIPDGSKPPTWVSLIPEVYFDVISRIPPGVLLVIGLIYAVRPTLWHDLTPGQTTSGNPLQPPYTLLFIFLIGAGYAAGIMLSVCGALLSRLYFRRHFVAAANAFSKEVRDWTWKLTSEAPEAPDWLKLSKEELQEKCGVLYRRQHDHLKAGSRQAMALLPKMDAEAKLCGNTSAACFSLAVLLPAIRCLRFHEFKQCWLLLVLLIGGIVSFLCAWQRNRTFTFRQFSFAEEMRQSEERSRTGQ